MESDRNKIPQNDLVGYKYYFTISTHYLDKKVLGLINTHLHLYSCVTTVQTNMGIVPDYIGFI